ncbi:MAG TPA: hypothetical protein VGN23_15875 [Verrucomicrobiae bacterium]|jgi:hypothetical protein
MKATLNVINQMQADGIIGQYAIGGAIGATFYLEPVATFDIDIFIALKNISDSPIISLEPVYSYLKARGCKSEKEHIIIEDWQVQFLPTVDALDEEALTQAVEANVDGVKTRVMTAEHLTAIAIRTGRPKDKVRVAQFFESGVLDEAKLNSILKRHDLLAKWEQVKDKYLEG